MMFRHLCTNKNNGNRATASKPAHGRHPLIDENNGEKGNAGERSEKLLRQEDGATAYKIGQYDKMFIFR